MTNKRELLYSAQYRKDYKNAKKQGKNIAILRDIVDMLANDIPLPPRHRDHALVGRWRGHRECHITPDWLLIYKKTDDNGLVLLLARAASHSSLGF